MGPIGPRGCRLRRHFFTVITHVITTDSSPPINDLIWLIAEEKLLGYMEIFVQKSVWLMVADDNKFPVLKDKWDELKHVYGGIGAMSTFNAWTSLTSTKLDENTPFHTQIQKLNNIHRSLEDNNISITDL
jgi:hypothetical protein